LTVFNGLLEFLPKFGIDLLSDVADGWKRINEINERMMLFGAKLVLSVNLLQAQQANFSSDNASLDSVTDLQTMLEAIESVPPVRLTRSSRDPAPSGQPSTRRAVARLGLAPRKSVAAFNLVAWRRHFCFG